VLVRTVPATAEAIDPATDDGRARLAELYARDEPAYVRLNMITSLTGSAAGADGTSDTLTSAVDRTILGIIRAHADVVLVGAQSVRAEGYIVPRATRLAIATSSGRLDGHRLRVDAPADLARVLVVCAEADAAVVRERVEPLGLRVLVAPGTARLTPADMIAALRADGSPRIVCEGGPSLASQFAAAGAIDEYCVTVAPVIEPAAEPFVGVASGTAPRTRVAGALADDAGFSYLRLRPRE
jgi:riboflavin biosynthesis pyrimidine reductase